MFKKTSKQREAIDLLASKAKHIMLYGGSRSGKTFITIYALIVRASKVKSRHLVVRLRFNHVKTSVWLGTLPKVLSLCFPGLKFTLNKSDYFLRLSNGSEIWFAGLDDKERTEKILGNEYSTIFFNECSQIHYTSIGVALTRLAEKNELSKRAYYDENPPSKKHWSYAQFILKKRPTDWEDLKNPDKYASILLNPHDNLENIDEGYIDEILNELPEEQRARFRDGQFTDEGEGLIYKKFDRELHVREFEPKRLPIWCGMDFNVDPYTAIFAYVEKNSIYVFDELWLRDSNTPDASKFIRSKFGHTNITIVPDSTGDNRSTKSSDTDHTILRDHGFRVIYSHNPFRVDRYNCVNNLFEKNRMVIHPRCKRLIRDLEVLAYKEGTSKPDTSDKDAGHITDGLGYLAWHTFPLVPSSKLTIRLS